MPKKKRIPPPFEEMKNSFIQHYQNMFIIRAILDNIDHDLRYLTAHALVEVELLCPVIAELRVMQRSLSHLRMGISKIKDKEIQILKKDIKKTLRKENKGEKN